MENFARAKKLPSLEKVLGRRAAPQTPQAQTEDEMLAALRTWAAITNGGTTE